MAYDDDKAVSEILSRFREEESGTITEVARKYVKENPSIVAPWVREESVVIRLSRKAFKKARRGGIVRGRSNGSSDDDAVRSVVLRMQTEGISAEAGATAFAEDHPDYGGGDTGVVARRVARKARSLYARRMKTLRAIEALRSDR